MTGTAATTDVQAAREQELVERVVASFDGAASPRFRDLMQALVRHLHEFVRETRLTEREWEAAVAFLRACGDLTDERRHEFILLSDVLGVSMQTVTVNNEAYAGATEATVLGPFFVEGSPEIAIGGDIADGAAGEPCWVEGHVRDTSGRPVAGARVDVWEADDHGLYDVQYEDERTAARGHLFTDAGGRYAFWCVTPTPYPVPDDGPVGRLLAAANRSPMRASHLHLRVAAEGFRTLVTHVFVEGDEHLASDSVFGVRTSLVRPFDRQESGTPTPDGRSVDGPWTRAHVDIALAPDDDGAARGP